MRRSIFVMIALVAAGLRSPASGQTLNYYPSLQQTLPMFTRLSDIGSETISSTYLFSAVAPRFVESPKVDFVLPWNASQHTFLAGPEIHLPFGRHITVNVWARAGVAKTFAFFNPFRQPTDATPPHFGLLPNSPTPKPEFNGANAAAVSLGSSVEYKIEDHLTVRPIQAEYLMMPVNNLVFHDTRVSAGLRLSFGR